MVESLKKKHEEERQQATARLEVGAPAAPAAAPPMPTLDAFACVRACARLVAQALKAQALERERQIKDQARERLEVMKRVRKAVRGR